MSSYVGGAPVEGEQRLQVRNPYTGDVVGEVILAGRADTERAIEAGSADHPPLSRFHRYEILQRARELLLEQLKEFSRLITSESGLCVRETEHEVGRAADVLQFAAIEALRDDGQVFSCDVTPHGKARKIFTLREPVRLAAAITPFNHPLNQVAHKLAPAVAADAPLILKPSEQTPLTAIRFAELVYQAGLPRDRLSVLLGPTDQVAGPLVQHPAVEFVSFTGSVAVGKQIASTAGYKRLALELGGNDPLIVLNDADLNLAARLAAEGAFRNSGQRCTAVKRVLVERAVVREFTELLLAEAAGYACGDPADPATRVGAVIDEEAAIRLERLVRAAVKEGAQVLAGGWRRGALMAPTVLGSVSRESEMVRQEAFGPLAPILEVEDLDDALALANSTPYGLSAGVVTRSLESALKAVRGLRTGTVNINEVPGYRIELSPFGGIRDSGLGVKEGVVEAIKSMTTVKTWSLPWGREP